MDLSDRKGTDQMTAIQAFLWSESRRWLDLLLAGEQQRGAWVGSPVADAEAVRVWLTVGMAGGDGAMVFHTNLCLPIGTLT